MVAKSRLWILLVASLILPEVARAQERPTVIRATTLLDGKGGVIRNVSIVVQGTRITRIDPSAQGTTYDLKGLTVMPGWIDTHVHIDAHFDPDGKSHDPAVAKGETPEQTMLYAVENAYNVLMAGFTTVQSVGSPGDRDLRNAIARGTIPGPRLLTSLRPVNETTGTPEQIRAFVRQVVADGADLIKIFATKSIREGGGPTLTQAQVDAACGEARSLGKRAIVHAQGSEGARAAVLAGCTSVEHGYRLTDEVLDLMAQKGTYYDPNFGLLLHNYIENKQKFLGIGNFNEEGFEYMQKGIPIGIDTFKRALNRKIKMVFGTDVGAGGLGRNYEEFIYRIKDGGQPPMDAIISATFRAAESMRMQDKIGILAPGMEADIIAVDGNPLDDVTAFRRVVFVMKGGKVYKNVAPGRTAGNY
ncbi:MAG TPA: amidohydrolase family protein [Terriglobia bacterium]|nr:amidohydrolase family protein [Terriglobia bacterium]